MQTSATETPLAEAHWAGMRGCRHILAIAEARACEDLVQTAFDLADTHHALLTLVIRVPEPVITSYWAYVDMAGLKREMLSEAERRVRSWAAAAPPGVSIVTRCLRPCDECSVAREIDAGKYDLCLASRPSRWQWPLRLVGKRRLMRAALRANLTLIPSSPAWRTAHPEPQWIGERV
ncbi:MAG: hypothetical protein JST08_09570 [Actinobacteria bacterium]|nr:hypothetical protein [Actinomycetota bacterium]